MMSHTSSPPVPRQAPPGQKESTAGQIHPGKQALQLSSPLRRDQVLGMDNSSLSLSFCMANGPLGGDDDLPALFARVPCHLPRRATP